MMTGTVLTATLTLLLGLSTVAYAQGGLPKRQMSHGVVTSWEHPEGRRCAYVRMAGRWYSTRIVPALDGFATLHAIRDSNRRKTPIMFSVLPPITECGPLPGIRDLDSPFVASPAAVIQTLAWGRHRHRSGGYLMPGTPLAHPRASGEGVVETADQSNRTDFRVPSSAYAGIYRSDGATPTVTTFWTAAMMLEHLGETPAAKRLMKAVGHVTADPSLRRPDLGGKATTKQVTDALCEALWQAND